MGIQPQVHFQTLRVHFRTPHVHFQSLRTFRKNPPTRSPSLLTQFPTPQTFSRTFLPIPRNAGEDSSLDNSTCRNKGGDFLKTNSSVCVCQDNVGCEKGNAPLFRQRMHIGWEDAFSTGNGGYADRRLPTILRRQTRRQRGTYPSQTRGTVRKRCTRRPVRLAGHSSRDGHVLLHSDHRRRRR